MSPRIFHPEREMIGKHAEYLSRLVISFTVKEARKEIGTWRFQKDGDKRLGNVEPEFSWANKFAASASKLEILKSEKSSTNLADNNRNKKTVSEPDNAYAIFRVIYSSLIRFVLCFGDLSLILF